MSDRACVAIIEGNYILMILQTYRGATFWTLPGGSIEPGETPEQAAVREALEETGLQIELQDVAYIGPRQSSSGTYYCFYGQRVGGQLTLGNDTGNGAVEPELHDLRWFRLGEMQEHPEVARIITSFQRGN